MRTAALLVAVLGIALPAWAAQAQHRELGPHQHGHGTLNIAIEGERVSMELDVPGADIVGFEHAASTADQKAATHDYNDYLLDQAFTVPLVTRPTLTVRTTAVGGIRSTQAGFIELGTAWLSK